MTVTIYNIEKYPHKYVSPIFNTESFWYTRFRFTRYFPRFCALLTASPAARCRFFKFSVVGVRKKGPTFLKYDEYFLHNMSARVLISVFVFITDEKHDRQNAALGG